MGVASLTAIMLMFSSSCTLLLPASLATSEPDEEEVAKAKAEGRPPERTARPLGMAIGLVGGALIDLALIALIGGAMCLYCDESE